MTIKVGDKVDYMGQEVTVSSIDFMPMPYSAKLVTIAVKEIDEEIKDFCQFSFSDYNKWAWGHQIKPLDNNRLREAIEKILTKILK